MMAYEWVQTLLVTAAALGAFGLMVRRAVVRKKRQVQAPGCAACPSAAPPSRRDRAAAEQSR